MVNVRDVILFTVIALGGLGVFIGVGGLELAGTNTANIACSIPGVSSLSYCSSQVDNSTRYKLTSELTVSSAGVDQSSGFRYKTSKDTGFSLSFASAPDFSVVGANDVRVDYVLRDENNRVVGSDRKRLGDIEAAAVGGEGTKDVTFSTDSLPSGEYTVEYVVTYEFCSVVSSIIGDCEAETDDVSKTVSVPKLPLGEY